MTMKRFQFSQLIMMIWISLFCLFCLIPFVMVISGSLSTEADIAKHGYTLVPLHPNLTAYRMLFLGAERIIDGYKISIFVTIVGTVLAVIVNYLGAYAMARRTLKYRNALSIFALLTLMFNGGLVPWYIICVNYLHLKDTVWALILPPLAQGFNLFLIRNFLQSIPEELFESSKIDGASEWRIMLQIIAPLAKPVLATISLFVALNYWNDWFLGLMFVDNQKLQPLQLMLRTIVSNVEFLKSSTNSAEMQRVSATLPTEGVKMAVTVITIGPIIFLYPFLQKYFVKGLMVGAVKG
ncbi:carbohydrate ABC transporter permease [Paenibacillus sp. WQ 127069]|uniref:Carbohydrate ABC transporter permease n=1 Tax=Paenibacillus baimaensis TaxID=2982185 RepID=A0ABT2UN85_9BACL|nr:carbohydrate ABC transporter permease [Paenibacillus sp. WQ 127069]MCU6795546.1 carbohydrate ABC transporter permease [Paenibacillus sp. WQ 127069]